MSRFFLIAIVSLVGESGHVAAAEPRAMAFREVSAGSGVRFSFHSGSRNRHDLPEIMGGGVAVIDADGDGRLDLFLCNGGPIVAEPGKPDPPCRLFLNKGNGQFEDFTDRANAPGPPYAMGAAVGDFDGDGRDDLFVSGWRDQRLYRNLGGGRFEDVTRNAGLESHLWSTSAAFADLDGDGDLDLFVATYVDFDPTKAPYCAAPDGKRDFCGPEEFSPQPDRLYRNNRDGTFTDISRSAGIEAPDGRGLGVVVADLVGDSKLDIFVANDGTACRLFENKGGLRFADVAGTAGVAVDGDGRPLAGMGVAVGDVDGDGRMDLLASNFLGRGTVGFRNLENGVFSDDSGAIGLKMATRSVLGFGLILEDFDGDGDLDLFQANGHVLDRQRLGEPFAMPSKLLQNDRGRFVEVPGEWLSQPRLGRGVAVGDLDGDARPDLVVNSLDQPASVLRNESTGGNWLSLELVGKAPACRVPIGAKVQAKIGAKTIVRELIAGGSYLSASDRRLTIGLGPRPDLGAIQVTWPSGHVERFAIPAGSQFVRIVEGAGL